MIDFLMVEVREKERLEAERKQREAEELARNKEIAREKRKTELLE